MKPGYAFVFLLRVRLIAYVYPLLPGIYTQNRDIIDWYITEPKKAFTLCSLDQIIYLIRPLFFVLVLSNENDSI
jgi:hypothetical protein